MSQPKALTTAELQAYSDQLANGTVADAEQVYADLYSKGYNYAGWAGGVASENTIAGVSAVNYLTGGKGDDTLLGAGYADAYLYDRGDGADSISDNSISSTYVDTLSFGEGIEVTDIATRRAGSDLLIALAGQAGDQITIKNWFASSNGSNEIEQLKFADGTIWTAGDLTQLALTTSNTGTDGDDVLSGTAFHRERLIGGLGNDTLSAVGSLDVLDGGAGNDTLSGLAEGVGTTFIGGTGDDTLTGSGYSDAYVFNRGDGKDTIVESGDAAYVDALHFGSDISLNDVSARRSSNDLIITASGQAGDQVTIKNWFVGPEGRHRLERVYFASGSVVWTGEVLAQTALATTNTGSAGNNYLIGTLHYADSLIGADGDDTLVAMGDGDVLNGGSGNDTLNLHNSSSNNTVFIGGSGNDTMRGGGYSDTYVFNRGDGVDTVTDNGYAGFTDKFLFGEGIAEQDLWFSRSGDHLVLHVLGEGDRIQVSGWYASANYRIEEMQLSDGQKLLAAQVDSLVNAMAAFAPPAPGQTTLTPEQQTALAPVIAAAWN